MDLLDKWGRTKMKTQNGFTLVEMVVVVSLTVTLLSLVILNLVRSQQSVSLTSMEATLLADLRQQQLKSMNGDTEGRSTSDQYGVHFNQKDYVLFHGTYSSGDTYNTVINLDSNMQFNNPNFDVIFSKIGGEITQATIIDLQDNTNSHIQRTHLNIYGAVTQIESL